MLVCVSSKPFIGALEGKSGERKTEESFSLALIGWLIVFPNPITLSPTVPSLGSLLPLSVGHSDSQGAHIQLRIIHWTLALTCSGGNA